MIIWAVVLSALMVASMSMYPIVSKAIASLPQELKDIVGPINNINDYFAAQACETWILFVGIYGATLAYKLITKQLKGREFELVYTAPFSRGEIVRTKALRLFINVSLVNIFVAVFSGVSLYVWGQINIANFVLFSALAYVATLSISYFVFALCLLFDFNMNAFGCILVLAAFYLFYTFSANVATLGYFTPISVISGNVLTAGLAGIKYYGVPLAIWSVASLVLCMLGFAKFKKADLC